MLTYCGLFYTMKFGNNVKLYVYDYIFVVNDLDDILASSGIILQDYFLWYWPDLGLYFLV